MKKIDMKCKCGSEMIPFNGKVGVEGFGLVCTSMNCRRQVPPGAMGEDMICVRPATSQDYLDPEVMVRVGWVVTWGEL